MQADTGRPPRRGATATAAALVVALQATGAPAETSACADRVAEDWLEETFGAPPPEAGTLTGRQRLETPVWLRGAEISQAKYAVTVRRGEDGEHVALSGLRIGPLASRDAYGAGIRVEAPDDDADWGDSVVRLFLHDIVIAPEWPDWRSYGETNYDAVDFAAPGELYGHAVRISDWNADAALDIKADRSQFVGLEVSGPGNRPIRYWRSGPHDLVASSLSRPDDGPLVWFADCDAVTLRVHDTEFNGAPRLSPDRVSCERGEDPEIVYLSEDPRRTGEIHPMLRGCPSGG
ncbi:hypothetical protein [Histidinibacterium lentulum]|uniref:Uncharacterized protein n=1 Tax=Histidinibacterium lentulum TaxID=2480588 RepID=A0A3N2QS42_9RHOB|nr:hypothetical protein [Histidinibacterium lentulum]ROT97999.1 hypothetical protein EAT49_17135 [Histidinibacterium lentulum]